ncbi:MAG: mucoidy inhibitor MuiA family protein [Desulfobacterales bacterium]
MKRAWLAAAAMVLAAAGGVCAKQTVSSEITEATVFFDRARVGRHASVQVAPGTQRLIVPVKAFSIDRDSVTAEIRGEGELLGVQVTEAHVLQPGQEKIRELEKTRDELALKKRALEDEIKALGRQEAFLDGVVEFSQSQVPRDIKTRMPSAEELGGTVEFLGSRYTEILDKKLSAETKKKDLAKEIKKIERELDMLRGRADSSETVIEILFRSAEPQDIDITARYFVPDAGWSPVYRAAASDAKQEIDLSMMAEISQKTGEDWKDADITVSTMTPVKGGRLPELSPWHLDTPEVYGEKSDKDSRMRTQELAAGAPGKSRRAPAAEAEKHETAISFEYSMPEPVTIESRDKKTLLPVFTKSVKGKFHYRSVPKKDPRAYLVCEAEADRQLLAGRVRTFFDGRYTGTLSLEEKQPGQSFVLGLGADRSVSVSRNKVKDKRKETAFFGKIERDAVVREITYHIEAENLKDRKVELNIFDHVPVSKTDRITVEDVEFEPGPDKRDVDGKQGVVQWQTELGPGESSGFTISFTAAYPKDMPPPAF